MSAETPTITRIDGDTTTVAVSEEAADWIAAAESKRLEVEENSKDLGTLIEFRNIHGSTVQIRTGNGDRTILCQGYAIAEVFLKENIFHAVIRKEHNPDLERSGYIIKGYGETPLYAFNMLLHPLAGIFSFFQNSNPDTMSEVGRSLKNFVDGVVSGPPERGKP